MHMDEPIAGDDDVTAADSTRFEDENAVLGYVVVYLRPLKILVALRQIYDADFS